jgi:hypothetical protein
MHIEMKPTPLEGENKNNFVACRRSDLKPTMATRSAVVDMAFNGDSTLESELKLHMKIL